MLLGIHTSIFPFSRGLVAARQRHLSNYNDYDTLSDRSEASTVLLTPHLQATQTIVSSLKPVSPCLRLSDTWAIPRLKYQLMTGLHPFTYNPLFTQPKPSIWWMTLGLHSLSVRTSYRNISRSVKAARFGFKLFRSPWNLTGTSAVLLPRCMSNFRSLSHPISWLRDLTRCDDKTSCRLVNRGPGDQ